MKLADMELDEDAALGVADWFRGWMERKRERDKLALEQVKFREEMDEHEEEIKRIKRKIAKADDEIWERGQEIDRLKRFPSF